MPSHAFNSYTRLQPSVGRSEAGFSEKFLTGVIHEEAPFSGFNFLPSLNSEKDGKVDLQTQSVLVGTVFNEKIIRNAFFKKIYGILALQLFVTAVVVSVFLFVAPLQDYIGSEVGAWVSYLSYSIFFVCYITLACCSSFRKKSPGNFICLVVFTIALSYMLGTISSHYNVPAILVSLIIACFVTFSFSITAHLKRMDINFSFMFLFGSISALILLGIGVTLAYFLSNPDRRLFYTLQAVFGSLAAYVFVSHVAVQTHKFVSNTKEVAISQDDYIRHAWLFPVFC